MKTNDECIHCYDDETVEYTAAHQTWWCTSCGAHWHYLALNDLHYFNNGEVHGKKDDRCVEMGALDGTTNGEEVDSNSTNA